MSSALSSQIASSNNIPVEQIKTNVWYIISLIFINFLIYVLLFVFYGKYKNIDFRASKLNFKQKPTNYLLAVAIGIIVLLGCQYIVGLYTSLLKNMGYPLQEELSINPTNFGSFTLAVFLLGLLPAIGEELIFRGVVLNGLRKRFSPPVAVILSSCLFALMHGNLQQLLYPFILGMVMAWIVVRTGSIVISMVVHFVNNFIAILFEYLKNTTGFSMDLPNVWWSYILSVLLFLLTFALLFIIDKFVFKHKEEGEIEKKEQKTSIFLYIAFGVILFLFLIFTILQFASK